MFEFLKKLVKKDKKPKAPAKPKAPEAKQVREEIPKVEEKKIRFLFVCRKI